LYKRLILSCLADVQNMVSDASPRRQKLSKFVFDLLPAPIPNQPWDNIGVALFDLIKDDKIFWSQKDNGCYVSLKEAIIMEDIPTDMNTWNDEEKTRNTLHEIFAILENLPVIFLPKELVETLSKNGFSKNIITPGFVRSYFSQKISQKPPINESINPTQVVQHQQFFPSLTPGNGRDRPEATSSIPSSGGAGGIGGSGSRSGNGSGNVVDPVANAIFLLTYATKDVTRQTYDLLKGLRIVPLESGNFGTVGDQKDPPVFIVDNEQRELLKRAGDSIVVSDNILGVSLSAIFKDSIFTEMTNFKVLSPTDVPSLLRLFLPKEWLANKTSLVNQYDDVFTDVWLQSLWKFAVDKKCVDMLVDSIPVLPIVAPPQLAAGKYVVKISQKIPLIRRSQQLLKPLIIEAFSELGIYIFDSDILQNVAHSKDFDSLIYSSDEKGILNAFKLVNSTKITEISRTWSDEKKEIFKNYVLDNILSKTDDFSSNEKKLLGNFCIWPHFHRENDKERYFEK
jgi:hypothetical protein